MGDYWPFGYPWFHRRYVDLNADDNNFNFASLADCALPALSQLNADATASVSLTKLAVATSY
jgi:hypothetical protein